MIQYIELSTVNDQYFKLECLRTGRDITGTYKLIRYRLPDDENIRTAVANQNIVWYMSEYIYMSEDRYMATRFDYENPGVDLDYVAEEKIVTDVSSILRYYDVVLDNRDIDPNKVYVYVLQIDESSTKYMPPFAVGYIEGQINSFSTSFKPTITKDWMKHRGIADLAIVNDHFDRIFYDILFAERHLSAVDSKHDNIIDNIKVNDLLDQFEQVVGMYRVLQKNLPPAKTITKSLDWGVADWGTGVWGFAEIVIELGFPYTFS